METQKQKSPTFYFSYLRLQIVPQVKVITLGYQQKKTKFRKEIELTPPSADA